MKHQALEQFDYHIWANERLLKRLEELPETFYTQELKSVFPSISAVVEHQYVTDRIWLQVMKGDKYEQIIPFAQGQKEKVAGKSTGEIKDLFATLYEEFRRFFSEQEDLDRLYVLEHPQGKLDMKLSDMIFHVVNHGTYHRGNIGAMFRQMDQAGASLDYVFYATEKSTV
ncbi:DinB family protein [Marininema halotolerans]|uniref:Uncharacterized damage-inducible protein DinB (Forms a four-helix bundle) n=1 Tax=Marininema halotolerans TaxID=1155944 RepID=A0A1I6TJ40_9BACL|nr:DinB family protein [Marininema halotolerans]SFS89027.1 Uncharacterized damage-inducible protein DinB (forms a four-helix bundle) [Marininema halotolerans]